MPTLIRWREGAAEAAEDPFTTIDDDQVIPQGDVIISLKRFQSEGDWLLGQCRHVGVRVQSDEAIEDLAYDLPRIAVISLVFPKFRDGRAYSAARLLRERFAFSGEVRAVGDVLVEQAPFMIRCGFDAFQPTDGTDAAQWTAAGHRYAHVYQRAADGREPAFAERGAT